MKKITIATLRVLLCICLASFLSATYAANPDYNLPEELRVGVIEQPPFVMQNPTGEWVGLSCDLLHAVARELGAGLELVAFDSIEQLEEDMTTGKLHLVPVAIVTASFEQKLD